jgi:uncharacterized membrane protein
MHIVIVPAIGTQPQSPAIGILITVGGAVFGVLGGLHALYTLLDLRKPRRPCVLFSELFGVVFQSYLAQCRVGRLQT